MTTADNPPRPSRPAWVAALLLTALAGALHLWFLFHAGGLWRDETNLVNLAGRHSLAAMAQDSFPVLLPLAVHGWLQIGFGQPDFSLRCLGALIGLGLIAAFWLNAWTTRRAPPWLGLTLGALNSTVLIYGDSLRAHGLGSLTIVLAFAAAAAFLKKPSSARAGWFALAAVLSVQALYQNAVLILAICLGAALACARRRAWRDLGNVFLAGLLAAISLLPYLPNIFSAPAGAASLRAGFQPDVIRDNLAVALGFPLPQYFFIWVLLAGAVVISGLSLLRRKTGSPRDEFHLFAAVTLLAALAAFGGFLWCAALPTQPWYFLPLMALAAATFDAGLPELPKKFRAAAAGLLAATALIAALFAQRDLNCRFTNVDVVARRLAAVAAPEDFVIVTPWFCGISFERYFKCATPWTTLPPLADHTIHRYDLVGAQMQNPAALAPVLEKIASTLAAGRRVWVAGWLEIPAPDAPPPSPLPPPPLKYSGWSDTPYAITWAAQTAHFLRQHARTFEQVKLPPPGAVNSNEELQLFIAANAGPEKPAAK